MLCFLSTTDPDVLIWIRKEKNTHSLFLWKKKHKNMFCFFTTTDPDVLIWTKKDEKKTLFPPSLSLFENKAQKCASFLYHKWSRWTHMDWKKKKEKKTFSPLFSLSLSLVTVIWGISTLGSNTKETECKALVHLKVSRGLTFHCSSCCCSGDKDTKCPPVCLLAWC